MHHTAVLVGDIERASRFYLDAFDAHWLSRPATMGPPAAQKVFGGPQGVSFRFCYLGLPSGAVELIEFLGEEVPEFARRPPSGALPHFAIVVEDVGASVARVEACGGSRLWDEPVEWNGATVHFVADPDGNAIELFDVDLEGIVERTIAMFPETRP